MKVSILLLLCAIIFVGYGMYIQRYKSTVQTDIVPSTTPEIASPLPLPSLSPSPTAFESLSPSPSMLSPLPSGSTKKQVPQGYLIYPGATEIFGGSQYTTTDSGDAVFSWYKSEIEKRPNTGKSTVRTMTNGVFHGVISINSGGASTTYTIDQKSAGETTTIKIETP